MALEKNQRKISFAIVFVFLSLFFTNLINGIPAINNSPLFTILPKILLSIVYIYTIRGMLKDLTKKMVLFTLVTGIVICLNLFIPDNFEFFLSTILSFLSTCFPLTLFALTLRRWDYLFNYFVKASYVAAIFSTITYLTGILSFDDTQYSMGFSYSSVVFFILLLDNFLLSRKILSLIFSLPLVFVIVVYGSRGALACILMYLLIHMYRMLFYSKKKLQPSIFISVLILGLLSRKVLLQLLLNITSKFGSYSRTLVTLDSGNFIESDGRRLIYSRVWEAFKQEPFKVRGINADYALTGIYSHNFILELLYEFGLIIGLLIVTYIFIISIKIVCAKNFNIKRRIMFVFLSVWFPQLLLSNTIWVSPFFWLFFGLYLNKREQ